MQVYNNLKCFSFTNTYSIKKEVLCTYIDLNGRLNKVYAECTTNGTRFIFPWVVLKNKQKPHSRYEEILNFKHLFWGKVAMQVFCVEQVSNGICTLGLMPILKKEELNWWLGNLGHNIYGGVVSTLLHQLVVADSGEINTNFISMFNLYSSEKPVQVGTDTKTPIPILTKHNTFTPDFLANLALLSKYSESIPDRYLHSIATYLLDVMDICKKYGVNLAPLSHYTDSLLSSFIQKRNSDHHRHLKITEKCLLAY